MEEDKESIFAGMKFSYRVEIFWGLLILFGWTGFFFNKMLATEVIIITLIVYHSLNIVRKALVAYLYLKTIKQLENKPK